MTESNLYNVGYDVGFEDGFKEAQARIEELEAKLKIMAMDSIAEDLSIEMSSGRIEELEAENRRLKGEIESMRAERLERDRTTIEKLTGGKDE